MSKAKSTTTKGVRSKRLIGGGERSERAAETAQGEAKAPAIGGRRRCPACGEVVESIVDLPDHYKCFDSNRRASKVSGPPNAEHDTSTS
jgi:hypothetical protein